MFYKMLLISNLADEKLLATLEVICSMELVSYQSNCLCRPLSHLVSRPLANTAEVDITILTGSHIEETL